ncbi:hypothetical protein BN2476_690026 [Paraburkholderia piptadeniae]|uniref:Uncharacterized protein n=1 Tax=Paraburkholderia piptadeniae TaxID=1701573 RepID=A0A1N7SRR5_9BURK|nr:hypothetical protein BN2476_690026 [Paraburkholderia piptadeniae]
MDQLADIENVACLHPEVATTVCTARHPKWDERPSLLVVRKPDSAPWQRRATHIFR